MKIVQLVESLNIGGLEKIALTLSNELSTDHDITIISLNKVDKVLVNKWIPLNANIKLISLEKESEQEKSGSKMAIFNLLKRLRSLLKDINPDVIHTHHIGPLFYASLSTPFSKIKRVHTEHDIWYLKNPKSLFLKRLLSFITPHETVALTNSMKLELEKKFNIKKVTTVFNGIDLEQLRKIENAKNILKIKEDLVLGSCGRIVEVKNHKYLLQEAVLNPSVRFLIAGDGELLEGLKSQAPENVTFMGHQNDLSLFYSAIDALIIPSKNEGLPLSILESYYLNKAVFSTDVGSVHEVISDKKYLIKTSNNLKIQNIKNNLKINMKDIILKSFSLKGMKENYLNLYRG